MKLFWILVILLLVGGYYFINQEKVDVDLDDSTTAESLLPSMEGYEKIEDTEVIPLMTKAAETIADLAGQEAAAQLIKKMGGFITCYSEIGASKSQGYYDSYDELSFGIVSITDKNSVTDPKNLWKCTLGLDKALNLIEFNFCKKGYTISTPTNEFYVLYAGTTDQICQDICSGLEGCN